MSDSAQQGMKQPAIIIIDWVAHIFSLRHIVGIFLVTLVVWSIVGYTWDEDKYDHVDDVMKGVLATVLSIAWPFALIVVIYGTLPVAACVGSFFGMKRLKKVRTKRTIRVREVYDPYEVKAMEEVNQTLSEDSWTARFKQQKRLASRVS
jgi:hypothetical protein